VFLCFHLCSLLGLSSVCCTSDLRGRCFDTVKLQLHAGGYGRGTAAGAEPCVTRYQAGAVSG
jgi:hypothetical protein